MIAVMLISLIDRPRRVLNGSHFKKCVQVPVCVCGVEVLRVKLLSIRGLAGVKGLSWLPLTLRE